jgi:D-ribulokinase
MDKVVIGIDLGTQGARVLAVTPDGQVLASCSETLPMTQSLLPPGWFEQFPQDWWSSIKKCLQNITTQLRHIAIVEGVSIDSTSGTLLAIKDDGTPLYPAIMYNDGRSEVQAKIIQKIGACYQKKLGIVFGSSFALPKILWLKENKPEIFNQAAYFIHAADFITGLLSGQYHTTDTSNALKTGYDLIDRCWPDFIETQLEIPIKQLPDVVLPGTPIASVSHQAAQETGLSQGIPIFAGATDGTTAQIASGATRPGDWNSTLGTTLVLKGVSRNLVIDPLGRIYSHLHPEGWWMPGGASNTGTGWILEDFPKINPADLDKQVLDLVPSRLIRYPLTKRGERFPFIKSDAAGFLLGTPENDMQWYLSGLEGVALLERLAYDTLLEIGLEVGNQIILTGGGSKSNLWSQIRASVLNKTLVLPAITETAMGSAILAASGCWFNTVTQANARMVKIAATIDPVTAWQNVYQDTYCTFIEALTKREYIIRSKELL